MFSYLRSSSKLPMLSIVALDATLQETMFFMFDILSAFSQQGALFSFLTLLFL